MDKPTVDEIIAVIREHARLFIDNSDELNNLREVLHRDAVTYLEVVRDLRKMTEADIAAIRQQYEREQIIIEKIFK